MAADLDLALLRIVHHLTKPYPFTGLLVRLSAVL